MKKIIIKILIFILLFIPVFQTKAWLAELELQLNPWVWAFLKSFVSSNLWKLDFLKKVVEIINRDLSKYTPTQQVALTYFKLLIESSINWDSWWTLVWGWNFTVPKVNNWKIPFSSSFVKVDTLWNVQINKNGKREYFFPICLYHDEHRPVDWPNGRSAYSRWWRFNCIMARDAWFVESARKHWLMSILTLVQYTWKFDWLKSELTKIRKKWLWKDVLFLHVDNERDNSADWVKKLFRWYKQIADTYDKDPTTWKRMHPLYYLNCRTDDSLKQDAMWMVSDITWSYAYERYESSWWENGPTKIIRLETNWTKQPVTFVELNFWIWGYWDASKFRSPIWRKMTPIAMASVAVWARWVAYWRDWWSTWLPIEKHGFRNDLPIFSRDIKKLMSMWIIQQPDNPFKANCWQSDDKNVQIWAWTRKLNGEWYVILSNWNDSARNIRCSIEWLWYTPRSLLDVLSWWNWWTISWNSISVQVPAYHRRVVKLVK